MIKLLFKKKKNGVQPNLYKVITLYKYSKKINTLEHDFLRLFCKLIASLQPSFTRKKGIGNSQRKLQHIDGERNKP